MLPRRRFEFIRDRKTLWWGIAVLLLALGLWRWPERGGDNLPIAPLEPISKADDHGLFGLTKVHEVHLSIPASEWEVLQMDTVVNRGGRGGRGGF